MVRCCDCDNSDIIYHEGIRYFYCLHHKQRVSMYHGLDDAIPCNEYRQKVGKKGGMKKS